MKIYFRPALLAFFLLLSASFSFGQKTYTLATHSDIVTKVDSAGPVVLQIGVTSTATSLINIKWTILSDGFPQSGWTYSYCDLITCFTSGYNSSGTDPMDPKGYGAFTITVNGFNHIAKNEEMKLVIWDVKNPSMTDTLILAINATRLGIEANNIPSSFINLYPNPAVDYLNLNTSNSDFVLAKVIISNSLGQQVSEQILSNGSQVLPVSQLGKGLYFVRIQDNQGREAVKQFVKE